MGIYYIEYNLEKVYKKDILWVKKKKSYSLLNIIYGVVIFFIVLFWMWFIIIFIL